VVNPFGSSKPGPEVVNPGPLPEPYPRSWNPFEETSRYYDSAMAKKADERLKDDEAAQAEKEKGMAAGARNHADILAAAQSVARDLAGRMGIITIDDVVREMRRLGYREADIKPGDKVAKNWKGSVFSDAEWVCTGQIASREKSAHGRNVRQWALKSWLRTHPVNGTNSDASAFDLFAIFQEATHHYPAGESLCWVIGRDCLASSLVPMAATRGVKWLPDGRLTYERPPMMFGLPVHFVDGVGAVCVPRRTLQNNLRQVSVVDGNSDV